MHLTRHRATSSDDNEVTFPLLECWNPLTKVATLAAEVNKRRILCRVSMAVLRKKFRVNTDEPMKAVAKHRDQLRASAKRLIEEEAFEDDGSVVIRYKDL